MPRYFFDVNDGRLEQDEQSIECADLQAAVLEAKKLLPAMSLDEVSKDGEQHAVTVLVSDENGKPIYSAALSYLGVWLLR
ncbi:DUF6894 family protein [Methylobacterium sp. E-045]|uniref:DUF6894 family protein n=1 Tax=Methylobacterium sp. E-045 TaxID=2836575 RepID=UPI00391CFDF7